MEFIIGLLRGGLGIVVLLGICYLLSNNRKEINWRTVVVGMSLQLLLAFLLLKVPYVNEAFDSIAKGFTSILDFTEAGAKFLFGGLIERVDTFGYIFAFQVLPTIVFFSALSSILYYFGILQFIIKIIAKIMMKLMGISGSESLAAAANVFIGQTEAPLIVKPYLENMTKSEILCLMVGGMATIAGGVFAAYIGFLGGDDPESKVYFAKHLLTASIISAPAAIVAAKMLYPETAQRSVNDQLKMSGDIGNNLLDAISRGTTDGLKLAVNVAVMLLVFTSLIALVNGGFLWITDGLNEAYNWVTGTTGKISWNTSIHTYTQGRFEGFTFTYLLGLIFAPIAWLLGVPSNDILLVGQLFGQKTIINEFFAYAEFKNIVNPTGKLPLAQLLYDGSVLSPKAIMITTYGLCGFANIASIGIQIGGISAIAPGQRKNLTELGIKALIGGTVACFLTAAIAGMLV